MKREHLEHIIRASANLTNWYEFVIIGSQSILGQYPNPEDEFTVSAEADIFPKGAPEELGDLIEGAIGEGSDFHLRNGYYAQAVGPETAILPAGWQTRLHKIQNGNTDLKIGWCLDVRDLFLSKVMAGRDKDRHFCTALLFHGHVELDAALALVEHMPIDAADRRRLRATIRRWAGNT